jgi:signal transduction histidine kinase
VRVTTKSAEDGHGGIRAGSRRERYPPRGGWAPGRIALCAIKAGVYGSGVPMLSFFRRLDRSPLPTTGVVLLLSLAATGAASWGWQRQVRSEVEARCRATWPAAEEAFRRQVIRRWEGLVRLGERLVPLVAAEPERLREVLREDVWFGEETAFVDVGVAIRSEASAGAPVKVVAMRPRDNFGFNSEGRDLRGNGLLAPLLDAALDRGVVGVTKPFRIGTRGPLPGVHPLRTRVAPLGMARGERPGGTAAGLLFVTFDQTRMAEQLRHDLAGLAVTFEVVEEGETFAPSMTPHHDVEPTAFGVVWHVRMAAKPELVAGGAGRLNLPLLAFGGLASLAMAALTWRQVGRRMQAETAREELQRRTVETEKHRLDRALGRRDALLRLGRLHVLEWAEHLPCLLAETSALLGGARVAFWRRDDAELARASGEVAGEQVDGPRLRVPVLLEGRPGGVLAAEYADESKTWSGEEVEILKTIAQHLALALATEAGRAANRELVLALGRARELNELKTRVVNFVSHELRTPLAIIQSSTDMLTGYGEQLTVERRSQQLNNIGAAVQRMDGLVGQVLSLQKVSARPARSNHAEVALGALCERIKHETELAASGRCRVVLTFASDADRASGDARLLHSLLTNLVSNAIKYSPPGAEVELGVERRGEDAIFRVADRGIGIPAADRAGLFEDFFRASNIGSAPGFGLGLAIVKRCVEDHAGDIRIEPREGGGTLVTVTLPLYADAVATSAEGTPL